MSNVVFIFDIDNAARQASAANISAMYERVFPYIAQAKAQELTEVDIQPIIKKMLESLGISSKEAIYELVEKPKENKYANMLEESINHILQQSLLKLGGVNTPIEGKNTQSLGGETGTSMLQAQNKILADSGQRNAFSAQGGASNQKKAGYSAGSSVQNTLNN